MVFACQRDSFLKEFTSTVLSCNPTECKTTVNGKKQNVNCFEVILEDTILFPEGGGQPCDYGVLNDIPVIQVLRRGSEAVHYVEKPVKEGEQVLQKVDWERRLDHMQQHSGQHLITALADSEFGYSTTSWWLGEEISFIELDTSQITNKELNALEEIVNEKIRQALSVTVKVYEEGDPELTESRTRGLPKDHEGSVRVITIESIESNMCCGTHVSNLSQLQVVKLMGCEKGKKNKINVNFLVGNRVLKRFEKMYKNELSLNLLLRNGPDMHQELIEKLQKSVKLMNKKLDQTMKDLIALQVKNLKSMIPYPKVYTIHRADAEIDYINMFIKELNNLNILILFTIGDKEGYMVLHGPEDKITEFGPKLAEILDGKGNGKGNRYQARVKNLKNLNQAELLIKESA
uniref:Alanyl-transfer RNA synthetases family profile domain-containing protein n=1 Tax=Panstrongylus lignarius TaxID=156445 RepID=A0A224XPM8_9HEMI